MSYLGNKAKNILRKYLRRKHRVNTAVKTNATLPRVVMAKSNLYVQAQVVALDGKTVATARDKKASGKTKTERAFNAGKDLATSLQGLNISAVAFDRNGYLYHGRIKAFADGLREGGISL
jgi:large subunit ribosomal protein L18